MTIRAADLGKCDASLIHQGRIGDERHRSTGLLVASGWNPVAGRRYPGQGRLPNLSWHRHGEIQFPAAASLKEVEPQRMRAGSQVDLAVPLAGRVHSVVVDHDAIANGQPATVIAGKVKPIRA